MRTYLGDCLEIMKTLPDQSIDMVLADPPYGTTACKWDSVIPFDPMWAEIRRITKPKAAIVIFGIEPFSSALRMSNAKSFKYDWIWLKNRPDGFLNAKRQPMRRHEIVSIFADGTPAYDPQLIRVPPKKMKANNTGSQSECFGAIAVQAPKYAIRDFKYPQNVLEFPKVLKDRKHPTQKPVALLEYLIKTYTKHGETVLDFCMGSGSTGVACVNTGRDFIGIEKEEKYFKIANERIDMAAIVPLEA